MGDSDYLIATPDRQKVVQFCHVNMLKPYHRSAEPSGDLGAVATTSGGEMVDGSVSAAESVANGSGESESRCVAQEKPSELGCGCVESSEKEETPLVLALGVEERMETEEPTFEDAVPVALWGEQPYGTEGDVASLHEGEEGVDAITAVAILTCLRQGAGTGHTGCTQ